VIVSDAMSDDEFAGAKSVMHLKVSSVICVPLLDRGRLLGIIYVGNDSIRDLFQETTLRVLTVFASQAALIVANALHMNELRHDNRRLNERLEQYRFGEIVGTSPPMQAVFRKVEKIAPTDISVLITGETGTGKELIAREIHNRSPRAGKPFITINCGAIPENLLESELFGHVKGAFTGAVTNKQGRFEAADGGTLFLDEIGEMPIELQVKLLRAIQEKRVRKVGATQEDPVDVRIICATHQKLAALVAAGRFRQDLFYRINVIELPMPPLRECREDIGVIAGAILQRIAAHSGSSPARLSGAALEALTAYDFPGNIRELENILERAVALSAASEIGVEDLRLGPAEDEAAAPAGGEGEPLPDYLDALERKAILDALAKTGFNRTAAAKLLGITFRQLRYRMQRLGIREETKP
jgi:transcriptional regulator with GAF, ATPase, and Fis domain